MQLARTPHGVVWALLLSILAAGILGRGYWTPDEPREADIAWRMSWQDAKAVPLLAGEPFCEKPPLAYWVAAAAIRLGGTEAWVARLPNLLYALLTALAVGSLARRSAGSTAGIVAAAAISTLLLAYQVAIWLATDAPLLAAVALALLGLFAGFYAGCTRARLRGYTGMHLALALGFLSKSAAAWLVPALALMTLIVWERRWRELWRWELYAGVLLQAAIILTWVWFVYAGPDGPARLKIFFWNNLAGRFARLDAPQELQYAAAHRNSPGKYLLELPIYLWPWTLLVLAAGRRAWQQRRDGRDGQRAVRFALATFVPTLAVLSVAATARNIYLAPALPGVALLLGWWISGLSVRHDEWDTRALTATAAMLLLATLGLAFAVVILGRDAWDGRQADVWFAAMATLGLAAGMAFSVAAWRCSRHGRVLAAAGALLLAYGALLLGPASQIYRRVDRWQDLPMIGRAIGRDAAGRGLILFGSDETTRAFIDMYASTSVVFIPGPINAAAKAQLRMRLGRDPQSLILAQLPREVAGFRKIAAVLGVGNGAAAPAADPSAPPWAGEFRVHAEHVYSLEFGRRYALLGTRPAGIEP